jgi:hypothetical protein
MKRNESRVVPAIPLKGVMLRRAGESLDEQIDELRFRLIFYIFLPLPFFACAMLDWMHYLYSYFRPMPVLWFVLTAIVAVYVGAQWSAGLRRLSRLKLGRNGEREVGQALDQLRREDVTVFHDLAGPGFNVDHVVVSPQGVFAVETKNYTKKGEGKITFDGTRVSLDGHIPDDGPVKQVAAIADWIRDDVLEPKMQMAVPVTPVLLFPHWWVNETKGSHRVWVLNPGQLHYSILKLPVRFSTAEVHSIAFELSRRYMEPLVTSISRKKS